MRAAIRSFAVIAAFAAAATFTLSIRDALALGPGACNAYADRAVAKSKEMHEKKCGFDVSETGNASHPGPAWSIDRNAYIRECRKWTSEDTPNERNLARDRGLERCSLCATYANRHIAQIRANKRLSCGFARPERLVLGDTTPIWDSNDTDYESQFQSCLRFEYPDRGTEAPDHSTADARFENRNGMLRQCLAKISEEQFSICRAYESKATEQAKWNAEHKCGGTGPRWTTDTDEHFGWCTANFAGEPDVAWIKQKIKEQEEGRALENDKCEFRQSGVKPVQTQEGMKRKSKAVTAPPIARLRKKDPNTLDPIPSQGPSPFGGKSYAKPAEAAVPSSKPAAASSSAIDRLSGASSGPASGGSYKSKDGAPTQTRSSGGGETQPASSSAGELPAVRTMPSNAGSMSTGGGTPAWKGSTR